MGRKRYLTRADVQKLGTVAGKHYKRGEWTASTSQQLSKLADKLLDVRPGNKVDGLRSSPPKLESPVSSDLLGEMFVDATEEFADLWASPVR